MGRHVGMDRKSKDLREMDGWAQVPNGCHFYRSTVLKSPPTEHKLPSVMWGQEYQNEYLDMNMLCSTATTLCRVSGVELCRLPDHRGNHACQRQQEGEIPPQRQPKDARFPLPCPLDQPAPGFQER